MAVPAQARTRLTVPRYQARLRNVQPCEPSTPLHYLRPLLDELSDPRLDPAYLGHLAIAALRGYAPSSPQMDIRPDEDGDREVGHYGVACRQVLWSGLVGDWWIHHTLGS